MFARTEINMAGRQRGLTIVEILVAVTLSLILLAGVSQLFISSKRTYEVQDGLSRLQENGRFAVDYLARHVRMAGYMGCLSNAGLITMHNNLNNAATFANNFSVGIEGFEANGTAPGSAYAIAAENPAPSGNAGGWSAALDADLVGRVLPGTDVIVIRNASPASVALVSPYSDSAQVFVSNPNDLQIGDILMVTDCQKASVFQATNIQSTGFGTNAVHSQANMMPGNNTSVWGSDQSYTEGGEIMKSEMRVFYVGQGASGGPALFQRSLRNAGGGVVELVSDELVEGVENMQVLYGEDTNGDRTADAYRTAAAVADWSQVVSARISLLVRSPENALPEAETNTFDVGGVTVDPVDDRRLRQVFTTTITLRNRAS
jgi:type IV pilus assembly protein PilW